VARPRQGELWAAVVRIRARARDQAWLRLPARHASALAMDAALRQIEAGRGKQFNPAVVDAFLSVTRRRPAEVLPPSSEPAVVAAAV